MSGFHFANFQTAPSLQAVYKLLLERGERGATTYEINTICCVMNPATTISALRFNGLDIECRYEGTTGERRKVFRYVLMGATTRAEIVKIGKSLSA